MSQILRSDKALDDLANIALYLLEEQGINPNNFIRLIDQKFHLLAETPLMGLDQSRLLPELRRFPVGKYLIYYRPITKGIQIIRVLHSSRSIDETLFEC